MHNEIDSFSLNIINPTTFHEHKHLILSYLKNEKDAHPYQTEKKKAFLEQHIDFMSADNICEMDGLLKAASLSRVLQRI